MRKLILIFSFFPLTIFSQQKNNDSLDERINYKVSTVIDVMPEYPGGLKKMQEFIDKNIVRPPNYPKGKVYVKFIVDKTGKVTKPEILKSLNPLCDKAILEVLLKLPKFSIPKDKGKLPFCSTNFTEINYLSSEKRESTNSVRLKTCRSSIFSPTPMYFTGILN